MLKDYDNIFKLLQWIITAGISIVAIIIGGKRLRDLVAYYNQQRFNAAFGYHTVFRLYCKRLKALLDYEPNFWCKKATETNNSEYDEVSTADEAYQKRLVELSSDFIKYLSSVSGQIPITAAKEQKKEETKGLEQQKAIEELNIEGQEQQKATTEQNTEGQEQQNSTKEQDRSIWLAKFNNLCDTLISLSILSDYHRNDLSSIRAELEDLTDFFDTATDEEITKVYTKYSRLGNS
jgi:hypothetical protein